MLPRVETPLAIAGLSVWLAALTGSLAGCVTKSKADAQARAAYFAGQQAAFTQMQQQPKRELTVAFVGPVTQPSVKWLPGLTLSQAILSAGYTLTNDPKGILIHRNGGHIQFDPKRLLAGEDFPLDSGDIVDLQQ
jgi:hypothetical protein